LTIDQAAAIYLYTMECDVYKLLNKSLLDKNRGSEIGPFLPFLKLLLTALKKLPTHDKKVAYRGMKFSSEKEKQDRIVSIYEELKSDQKKVVWWNLSSTTEKIEILQSEQFCGKTGSRVMFTINASENGGISGKNIQNYSRFGTGEAELLFPPGCLFQIQGVLDLGNDLHSIVLNEIIPDFPLVPIDEFDDKHESKEEL